jgi:hydrogenase maturation protease
MLIIGCGNRQRGDDAAGVIAAERLRALGVEATVCSGETSELIVVWSGADDVIVIDAVVTGSALGVVHVWDGRHPPAYPGSGVSTHGLGVAEAIELARALDQLPARLQVYGIEGRNFKIGSRISPVVESAVDLVVDRIVGEVNATR